MKLSDYVAEFISRQGVKEVFLIPGGGMMHLLDSVGQHEALNVVCNLHEQASAICADTYGQYTNNLGVCMLTTGPGGTNAVTGIAASYLDSTPVLAISGQCKTADFASVRGVRQFGAQEVDIVNMVNPITKYAVQIIDKDTIKYHLEKAVYLAKTGRKGPVWIDIPLDIQAAQVNPMTLVGYNPQEEEVIQIDSPIVREIEDIYKLLARAKRPVILAGGGVATSGAKKQLAQLIEKLQIPVLTTWRLKDVFAEEHPLYYGAPGIPTTRYSNLILQNSDLLIIIGTRLNPVLTAYDEKHFGFQAKKVIVDIDKAEIEKLDMTFNVQVCCDAKRFLEEMLDKSVAIENKKYESWQGFCRSLKDRFPLINEKQPIEQGGLTDGYYFTKQLAKYTSEDDIFIGSSSGRTCGISHMAYEVKPGQRFISSMGLGSMGFVVPSAIGASFASGKRRVLALEGDGSLQHNIQELQLIKNYQLPIKLFILSNSGYASIYMMQKNNFKEKYVACHQETHLDFPRVEDIAKAYCMDYYRIERNEDVEQALLHIMKDNRPVLCEVVSSIYFDEIPKSMTIAHADGTFSSSRLENLYPFLSDKELEEVMPVWK